MVSPLGLCAGTAGSFPRCLQGCPPHPELSVQIPVGEGLASPCTSQSHSLLSLCVPADHSLLGPRLLEGSGWLHPQGLWQGPAHSRCSINENASERAERAPRQGSLTGWRLSLAEERPADHLPLSWVPAPT